LAKRDDKIGQMHHIVLLNLTVILD